MNQEIKVMLKFSFPLLLAIIVVINILSLRSPSNISEGSYSSQRLALNRVRRINITRSSELGKYPTMPKRVKLLAVRSSNRLYVISQNKVIYIANAKINLPAGHYKINAARGQKVFHFQGSSQQISNNWTSLGQYEYLESPLCIQNHRIKGDWLKQKSTIKNTIELSHPDAKWLQSIPKNTKITVK